MHKTPQLFLFFVIEGLFLGILVSPYQITIEPLNGATPPDPKPAGNFEPPDNAIDEIHLNGSAAGAGHGVISSAQHHIFWILQITDTQMVWTKWGEDNRRDPTDGRVRNLRTFFNTTQKIIAPVFIANTGDLVDSAYETYFARTAGQKLSEWLYYNETMTEMGMNASYYFDMPGNHDIYRDPGFTHFMAYSVSGSGFHTDQYMVELDLGFGKYSFYTFSTPENNGLEFPFGLGGYMSKGEIDWFEEKATNAGADSNRSFAFGHHPLWEIFSERSTAGNSLKTGMKKAGIDMYLFGHGHVNLFEQYGDMVGYETAKIDESNGYYRIIAVDNDGLSTAEQVGNKWPAGLITSPTDIKNTRTEADLEKNANNDKIRALAWNPTPIQSVDWRADSSDSWLPMMHLEGPLYEGNFTAALKDGAEHLIEVRITDYAGAVTFKSIIYCSEEVNFFQWMEYLVWYILGLAAFCFVVPSLYLRRRRLNPEKYGKKPKSIVNPKQAKRLLMRFLVLLFVPLTFGLIYAESVTAVFSLFLISKIGFLYSDVAMFLFAGMSVWLVPQMFCLSPKHRRGLRIATGFAIFLEGFLLLFFLLHYPLVSWCSPGFYLLLYLDVKMWREPAPGK